MHPVQGPWGQVPGLFSFRSSADPLPGPQGFKMESVYLTTSLEASHPSDLPSQGCQGHTCSRWHSTRGIFKTLNQVKSLCCLTPSKDFPSYLEEKPEYLLCPGRLCTVWPLATPWVPSQATLPGTRHDQAPSVSFSSSGH